MSDPLDLRDRGPRLCLRCGETLERSPNPRVVRSVHETPEECVRLLLAVIAEGVRYTSEAKAAAPERYRWIGRPLPEIVRAMAADLEEALARLAEIEEVDRG